MESNRVDNKYKDSDYEELKRNYMIVLEFGKYVVLNDKRIMEKKDGNHLVLASEDDETVKQIRELMKRREDANKPRRIDHLRNGDDREI